MEGTVTPGNAIRKVSVEMVNGSTWDIQRGDRVYGPVRSATLGVTQGPRQLKLEQVPEVLGDPTAFVDFSTAIALVAHVAEANAPLPEGDGWKEPEPKEVPWEPATMRIYARAVSTVCVVWDTEDGG